MRITRREFLIVTAGLTGGCKTANDGSPGAAKQGRIVDAGPASGFANDGIYAGFRDQGFFVIRRGDKLLALAAICTHRKCKLTAEADRSFFCKCHGSTFDPDGRVTKGPAKRDLPALAAYTDDRGRLLVSVPAN
ncbi:MAG TPA: Rieske (2Fe-2S) protein [Candidatus Acidoferrum sp.]|nr:Rieske (2Fe-2S) protein [Candidatus Acidoferrum sp.]